MEKRTEIDLATYPKRNQYAWFSKFPDPSYGFNVDIDVEAVVAFSKARGESFFPAFFYLVMKSLNAIPELRMREVQGHIYLYPLIHPTWTVLSESGVYNNVGCRMEESYPVFYAAVKKVTDAAKKCVPNGKLDQDPIVEEPDVVFATCLPNLEVEGMSHPTPSGDHDNLSIPRIFWDKYRKKEDGHYHLTLNITVSHTLVDGYPLAAVFNAIKAASLSSQSFSDFEAIIQK
jgi:chloramphenicol O-acetyltransferase type A